MDKLDIPRLPFDATTPLFQISSAMDHFTPVAIAGDHWLHYPHSVKAVFRIAHSGQEIFLKYSIAETYLLANAVTNQAVHEDSCVEFFVAFEDDTSYYNLEFNCLGWAKVAYGPDRENRQQVPSCIVEKIASATGVEARAGEEGKLFQWEITLVIPKSVFFYHDFGSFDSLNARGNMYKSGMRMPEPHFLTWKSITSAEPDFHRKDCFGHLEFT